MGSPGSEAVYFFLAERDSNPGGSCEPCGFQVAGHASTRFRQTRKHQIGKGLRLARHAGISAHCGSRATRMQRGHEGCMPDRVDLIPDADEL